MIARGRVLSVRGAELDARVPALAIGSMVRIISSGSGARGTVVSSGDGRATIAVLGNTDRISVGAPVEQLLARRPSLGLNMLGRSIELEEFAPARTASIDVSQRRAVDVPMWTGVRAIDALLTIGRGARIGIFGAPGSGKSTLLEIIVRGASVDARVIVLVGERGREAERWIEGCDKRTTVVCATSDRSASERIAAAHLGFAQARALADRGLHVLLVFDSLARFGYALRELRTADGKPVGRAGYPPSVFAEIAQLVEGAGSFARGSITLIATVLNDGDDHDPVSESARSLLDGHIQLSASLAHAGRYPAIDVLASASRTMAQVVTPEHRDAAKCVRAALARLASSADMRSLGIAPNDPATEAAIACEAALEHLLRQGATPESSSSTRALVQELWARIVLPTL